MIPSHQLAQTILRYIDNMLDSIGLDKTPRLEGIVYFCIIVAIAILLGWLLRKIILFGLRRWVRISKFSWGQELLNANTLASSCHIIPPLVLMACLPIAFEINSSWHIWAMRLTVIYFLITLAIAISAWFKFAWIHFDTHKNQRKLPIKGIYEVAVGILWIVIAIIAISVLINRSPGMLLTGLGAFAAALMLIFKDSILGFVAGIQMTNNEMLHVGDWITVPGTLADGVVTDVTITTVKVMNFDNTTVMLPPYTLVSTSFQNWRSMSKSNTRRIAKSILIDADTIRPDAQDPTKTNLDAYRAYILNYLTKHPQINHDTGAFGGNVLTMVRLMPATANGVPVQFYAFANTSNWPVYEEIQSTITAHILAAAPQFGLRVYNYPSALSSENQPVQQNS